MKTSRRVSPDCPPFLASEIEALPRERCRFHVIPVPYEASVSYGGGTAAGPSAILKASYQLEAFDGHGEPCRLGIHTDPPVDARGRPEAVLAGVERATARALACGGLPVVLGGEHTVTVGAVRALRAAGLDFGVVQFDAHADLRDSYEGSAYSHACAMRRVLDLGVPVYAVAVRAISPPEIAFRRERGLAYADAETIATRGLTAVRLPRGFPRCVYVSFDVDALDSSLMPATGTPEPGGLTWWQTMDALRRVTAARTVVGLDAVELAPMPGLHAPDFVVARLVYNMMGFAVERRTACS
jgi:agmatinase